ncbi:MAG: phosphatase PAP2 family protein [Candidatus Saccharimonadales bacterium]
MTTVTHLGDPVTVLSVAAIGVVVAARKNISGLGNAFMLTMVAYGLSVLLKLFLKRTRPDTLYVDEMVFKTYSFPSSHAFGAMVVYGFLVYLAYSHLPHPLNYLTATGLAGLIFLIGISRVYLGAHFPTDVIGGWLLGGLCLFLIIKFAVK